MRLNSIYTQFSIQISPEKHLHFAYAKTEKHYYMLKKKKSPVFREQKQISLRALSNLLDAIFNNILPAYPLVSVFFLDN